MARLALLEEKVKTIARMVHDDRPAAEVLDRTIRTRSALDEIGYLLWAEYLADMVVSRQENGAEELTRALERLGRYR